MREIAPGIDLPLRHGRDGLLIPELDRMPAPTTSWDMLHFFQQLWRANGYQVSSPLATPPSESLYYSYSRSLGPTENQEPGLISALYVPESPDSYHPPGKASLQRRVEDTITIAGLGVSLRRGRESYGIARVVDEVAIPWVEVIKGHYYGTSAGLRTSGVAPALKVDGQPVTPTATDLLPRQRTEEVSPPKPPYNAYISGLMREIADYLS